MLKFAKVAVVESMKIAATKMSERGQFSCLENGTANFLRKLLLPPKKTQSRSYSKLTL